MPNIKIKTYKHLEEWRVFNREDAQGNPCGLDIFSRFDGDLKRLRVAMMPDGATLGGGGCFPHQLENAHLIAAAPDLLKACRRALDLLDDPNGDEQQADRVASVLMLAILKAEEGIPYD